MNRIAITHEDRQTLQNARLNLEKLIKEAKAITRKPHTQGPPWASTAQNQLLGLKREATMLYACIAARRGKVHCADFEERLSKLRNRGARGFTLSETEKLIIKLFQEPVAADVKPSVAA